VLFGNPIFLKILELWKQYRGELLRILLPNLAHLTYSDRLKSLNLPSLYYRRLRMDMIMTYKILDSFVDLPVEDFFQYNTSCTRSNGHTKTNMKK